MTAHLRPRPRVKSLRSYKRPENREEGLLELRSRPVSVKLPDPPEAA